MNKDVIYIEPEDDITDIINKIEGSKEKIVALVPPKKASVLRSIVNIKLIAKSGANTKKTVVLVTTDPAILKLAAATKLPVTKDLQSAPAVPKIEAEGPEEMISKEELVKKVAKNGEEEVMAEAVEEVEKNEKTEKVDGKEDSENEAEKDSDADDAKGKKEKKKKEKVVGTSKNPLVRWVQEHKKLCISLCVALPILILVLVWALVIAPAATVTVGIRTTKNNFSENVTFTETLAEENTSEGKFFLQQKKIETEAKKTFVATGQKNVGERAKGNVVIIAYFVAKGSTNINAGATFTLGDLLYTADEDSSIAWDGKVTNCENSNETVTQTFKCKLSARVNVTANGPGTKYNIEASSTGWKTSVAGVVVYTDQAMAGGTDNMITVVQQSDIDNAIAELKDTESASANNNKERLFDEISDTSFIIEQSYTQSVGEPTSTPKVGEEVKEGEKATLSVVTTDSVYYIDNTKVEEFIKEKAKLAENYRIYSMDNPFIENFIKTDTGYAGKLKTSYVSGPKVTENDVLEIIKGKGLGTAQHDLKDIDGISSIKIDTSFPWVSSIPNDPNKITVILDVQE